MRGEVRYRYGKCLHTPKIEEGTKELLFVKGTHDKSFLEALIKRRGLPKFKILDAYKCCRKRR